MLSGVALRADLAQCSRHFADGSSAPVCASAGDFRFSPTNGNVPAVRSCRLGPEAGKDARAAFSRPAPHPPDIVIIGRAELPAHLGFLERNVDPIDGSEDGERRDEHRPGADPYGNAQ
jgi:hypothetical protein